MSRSDVTPDDRAWQGARASGNLVAYNVYLEAHPAGAHAAEARAAIGELRRPAEAEAGKRIVSQIGSGLALPHFPLYRTFSRKCGNARPDPSPSPSHRGDRGGGGADGAGQA